MNRPNRWEVLERHEKPQHRTIALDEHMPIDYRMPRAGQLTKSALMILGMRGNICRERVAAILEVVPGVMDVDVNLHRARATIVHQPSCTMAHLTLAVERQGYGVAATARSPRLFSRPSVPLPAAADV